MCPAWRVRRAEERRGRKGEIFSQVFWLTLILILIFFKVYMECLRPALGL